VLCTAIRVNQCSTHNNDHINQRQHTTTPPLHNDTLEARELPEVHNVDNTLWTAQDIMSYIIPPHSTPPPSGTAYTSPYQCGIARSLSQSPRIVGLQVQLGFVNVTCADLDVLESELSTRLYWVFSMPCHAFCVFLYDGGVLDSQYFIPHVPCINF